MNDLARAHRRCIMVADRFASQYLPMLLVMQRRGMGLRAMATAMNEQGYVSRQGGRWTDQTVRQMLKRRRNIIALEAFDEHPQIRYIGWGCNR